MLKARKGSIFYNETGDWRLGRWCYVFDGTGKEMPSPGRTIDPDRYYQQLENLRKSHWREWSGTSDQKGRWFPS